MLTFALIMLGLRTGGLLVQTFTDKTPSERVGSAISTGLYVVSAIGVFNAL